MKRHHALWLLVLLHTTCLADTPNLAEAGALRAAGEEQKALELYEKVAASSSDPEEIYLARMSMAKIYEKKNPTSSDVEKQYELAYSVCQNRREPLYYIGTYYSRKENFDLSARTLYLALKIPQPSHGREIEQWIYDWATLFEYSISCYWIGRYKETLEACDQLLAMSDLPPNYRQATERNRAFAVKMLQAPKW